MGLAGVRDLRELLPHCGYVRHMGPVLLLAPPYVGWPRPEWPVPPLMLLEAPNKRAADRIRDSILVLSVVLNL